jgi:hypothetical protein
MRQIGARQEAGRIGGIGSCGRELCCATWINSFVSVTTNAARYQELSLNPQKLAGQCSKLKCCLNYEVDSYMDERKNFPSSDIHLDTHLGKAIHIKTDVYRHIMWYVLEGGPGSGIIPLATEKVKDIIEQNKKGQRADVTPVKIEVPVTPENLEFTNVVGQESLTRFDSPHDRKKKSNNKHRKFRSNNENQK